MALGARTSTNPLPPLPPPTSPLPHHACRENTNAPRHALYAVHALPFTTMQRTNAENSEQLFPEKELSGHSPNFHIHVSVSNLCIPTIDLPILLQENMWIDPENI
jgi:hypothetical protein